MSKLAKASLKPIKSLLPDVDVPKPTQEEKNLARQQAERERELDSELARRRGMFGKSGRRSLLSGGDRGVA